MLRHVNFEELSNNAAQLQDMITQFRSYESSLVWPNLWVHPDMLVAKLHKIEAQLGINPVRIGDVIFNSLDNVKVFVETQASGLSFSLFHDAVMLLESLTDVYVERRDIISEWYQASRVGPSEVEAKHQAYSTYSFWHYKGR